MSGPAGMTPRPSLVGRAREIMDPPHRIEVVRSFLRGTDGTAVPAAFGLLGGAALAPEGLSSTLPLDWQAEALGFVQAVCAERRDAGANWLTFPPMALLGEGGSGRTHFVRQLSHHSGLRHHVWNLSRERPKGAASPNAIALPPEPLLAMIASRCANPIVVVVGVEQADASTIDQLAGMIDPRTSRRRVEHSVTATVDYSNISWVVVPETAAMLPVHLQPLLKPIHLFRPSVDDSLLVVLGAIDEAIFNIGLEHAPTGLPLDELVRGARQSVDFRTIYDRVHAAVLAHAHP